MGDEFLNLSKEEKEHRKQERQKIKWEKEHKVVNDIIYKLCNRHKDYFPNEEEWFPCTDEYFYKNKSNSIDGYYPECKKCEKKKARIWAKNNPEKIKIADKKNNDRKVRKEIRKILHKQQKESGYHENYLKNNPEKLKQYAKNHRDHDITKEEWDACLNYFNHCCVYCGMSEEEHRKKYCEKLHKDHVDDKGYNDVRNAAPACKSCNSHKHMEDFELWFREQSFFSEEKLEKIKWWITEEYKKYIEDKPPYRITRKRVYKDDGSYYLVHELWTVDEKRNMVECIKTANKKSELLI
jgi:hypothetical protein